MDIQERKVTVRELTEDYFNDAEEGVVGYGERLDIREFGNGVINGKAKYARLLIKNKNPEVSKDED